MCTPVLHHFSGSYHEYSYRARETRGDTTSTTLARFLCYYCLRNTFTSAWACVARRWGSPSRAGSPPPASSPPPPTRRHPRRRPSPCPTLRYFRSPRCFHSPPRAQHRSRSRSGHSHSHSDRSRSRSRPRYEYSPPPPTLPPWPRPRCQAYRRRPRRRLYHRSRRRRRIFWMRRRPCEAGGALWALRRCRRRCRYRRRYQPSGPRPGPRRVAVQVDPFDSKL
jgi:hypothetical protein